VSLRYPHYVLASIMLDQITKQLLLGQKDRSLGNFTYVFSNHFTEGKPTKDNPVPTLFMRDPVNADTSNSQSSNRTY